MRPKVFLLMLLFALVFTPLTLRAQLDVSCKFDDPGKDCENADPFGLLHPAFCEYFTDEQGNIIGPIPDDIVDFFPLYVKPQSGLHTHRGDETNTGWSNAAVAQRPMPVLIVDPVAQYNGSTNTGVTDATGCVPFRVKMSGYAGAYIVRAISRNVFGLGGGIGFGKDLDISAHYTGSLDLRFLGSFLEPLDASPGQLPRLFDPSHPFNDYFVRNDINPRIGAGMILYNQTTSGGGIQIMRVSLGLGGLSDNDYGPNGNQNGGTWNRGLRTNEGHDEGIEFDVVNPTLASGDVLGIRVEQFQSSMNNSRSRCKFGQYPPEPPPGQMTTPVSSTYWATQYNIHVTCSDNFRPPSGTF